MSGSSVRHTASSPSLRSSSHSSRSSSQSETSSRSASGFRSGGQTQTGYDTGSAYDTGHGASSYRTVQDSNVVVHTPTTTIGSSGNIYRVTVVEPAGSSTSARSSRMSGETLVASSRGPDSIRSYGSSGSSSRRAGDGDHLLMPPPSRRSGAISQDGGSGFGSSRNGGSGSGSLRR